jgi:glycosyltransferase involved in cell wall biosynthesis
MIVSSRPIALFSPSLAPGGAERVLVNLARGFIDRGRQVDVVLSQATGEYIDQLPENVKLVDLKSHRVFASLPGLVRYLRECRPAALFAFQDHCGVAAIWARAIAGVPTQIVPTVHTTWSGALCERSNLKLRLLRYLAQFTYPSASSIVAVSHGVAEDLSSTLQLTPNLIKVIYNPIVDARIGKLAGQPLSHPWLASGQPPVVIAAGRLSPEKDFATLLRAFAVLRNQVVCRLILLGDGPERTSLEQLARELGVQENVQFLGFVANPYMYMKRAAVFALSSVREGLPTALVEALSLNIPVVSTDCANGPREILCNGLYGTLVAVGDADGIAAALADVLLSKARTDITGAAERFTLDRALQSYTALLNPVHA